MYRPSCNSTIACTTATIAMQELRSNNFTATMDKSVWVKIRELDDGTFHRWRENIDCLQ